MVSKPTQRTFVKGGRVKDLVALGHQRTMIDCGSDQDTEKALEK